MKEFLGKNFLLQTETAEYLYHTHAAHMPVIDYHCHISPAVLAENRNFSNLAQAWLAGDHYKWRAMRANGVNERFITGDATDREKFDKWAETVPSTLGNPLYHWTHLELQRYFNIHDLLSPRTSGTIFERTAELLQQDDFRPLALLQRMQVEVVCTTDDPLDDLVHHQKIRGLGGSVKVVPAWRPDRLLNTGAPNTINAYLDALSSVTGVAIGSYNQLLEALQKRHDYFHEQGCRLSDHGLENFYAENYLTGEIQTIFSQLRAGADLTSAEAGKYRSAILFDLAAMDHERGWVQQYHVGARRNNNTRMFRKLGADTGFDSIDDQPLASAMGRFLDRLEGGRKLTKTILYNLNPCHNEVMATMTGNFQDGSVPGKMQWGSAWWFLDQKDGMEKQLRTLANHGLLSRFIGMLTDSRSLLSYPRHEYFRRILCNMIGHDAENGEMPNDRELLGRMVEDICYHNAKNYFSF
jgi:glucuronate isomerase